MTDQQTALLWDSVNPVLPGFYPDPSVCRVDGEDGTWFFLVNSTFEYLPGLPIHRSRDLINWELIGHVLDRTGQIDVSLVGDSGGLFAPTIRHDGTRFLLVCTLVGGGEHGSGNFVVTATDPAGPWSDPIWWDMDGIDPSIMVEPDGTLWAHGTRLAPEPEWEQQTEVWVRRLNSQTLKPEGEETIIWSGALRGAIWSEGPHLFHHEGYIYLLAAEGGTGFYHAIIVARAASPLGPFTGNPANPVLTHRNLGRGAAVSNVGHADLVEAPDGTWWAVCLATRAWDHCDLLGRETFLVPVSWEDGWPVFAPGEGQLPLNPGGFIVQQPSSSATFVNSEQTATSSTGRHGDVIAVRRHPSQFCTLTDDSDEFRIESGEGLSGSTPAFVAKRLAGLTTRVQVRLVDASSGVRAGLGLRYSATAFVTLTVGDGAVQIESFNGHAPTTSARTTLRTPLAAPDFLAGTASGVLAFELHGTSAVAVWEPDGGVAVRSGAVDISHLCAKHDGGFVGVTYGALTAGDHGFAIFSDLREGQ
ncbi:alpha-N-arabinofuranosidase [Arthrobacter stackebrandtii]|uniref:Alpha-N-arabinofuranosidase n=1 Tax=Arthrobacter stackebrandtii TaxID=272161 RepID=A0ABS4YTQ2_9MICC|nr:glycoside hydrolase family 43 protein [Arthrobacter stackebrandtii]MBP2412172.1 alpha-N-arabinofuranosidase [Arthrobacter stackebrandtii]PYH01965.1 glycoside hydrolase family 43 protein [Arthrobacter stackebrandtii]